MLDSFTNPWFTAVVTPRHLGTASQLAQQNPDRRLNEFDALSLARDFAVALAHVHSLRILHGDLRAANLLVHSVAPLTFVLCDFGSAVHLDYLREPMHFNLHPKEHRAPELCFASGAKICGAAPQYARPHEVQYDLPLGVWAYVGTVAYVASGQSLLDPWLRGLGGENPRMERVVLALLCLVGIPCQTLQKELGWAVFVNPCRWVGSRAWATWARVLASHCRCHGSGSAAISSSRA